MIGTSILVLLLGGTLASSEIHRCAGEDGAIVYQQMPCPAPIEETDVAEQTQEADPAEEAVDTIPIEDATTAVEEAPTLEASSITQRKPEDVETCKMPFRDAIDEIEAEMLRGYSAEEGEAFKQELRGLTEQMRACE